MTDEAWKSIPAILQALGVILMAWFTYKTRGDVKSLEKNTNSMVEKMEKSAEIKGEKAGKDKAEAAASLTAALTAATPLPIVMAPAPSENTATAEEIRKWIAMGVDLGEKARREARGNGPPKPA